MTQSLESPAPVDSDARAAAFDRVLSQVAERRAEFEEKRHVPRDMVAEFKRAGLYRAGAPKRFGGDALPPAEFLRLIERISEVDGSAGWVASFGSALVYLAALPLETQAELYADGPDVAFAGACSRYSRPNSSTARTGSRAAGSSPAAARARTSSASASRRAATRRVSRTPVVR